MATGRFRIVPRHGRESADGSGSPRRSAEEGRSLVDRSFGELSSPTGFVFGDLDGGGRVEVLADVPSPEEHLDHAGQAVVGRVADPTYRSSSGRRSTRSPAVSPVTVIGSSTAVVDRCDRLAVDLHERLGDIHASAEQVELVDSGRTAPRAAARCRRRTGSGSHAVPGRRGPER